MFARFPDTVFRPNVRNTADVRRYVWSVTLFALVIAEAADVVQRELDGTMSGLPLQALVSLFVVLAIAVPIARTMGLAHLTLHLTQREAERLSNTDSLTGLANRRAFYAAAAGLKGGAVTLAIADIDRFKRINDLHGHAAGDTALIAVAHAMRDELSDLGLVARLGGEEFGWICAVADIATVRDRLHRFRERVASDELAFAKGVVGVTVSAGFALREQAPIDVLYSEADRALYVAKSAGRNRVVAFADIDALAAEPQLRQAG